MFRYLKENMNTSKSVTEDIKRNQMEFLKMNITVSEMRNSLEGISRRLGFAEEKTGEFEDVTIQTINLQQREGKRLKIWREMSDLWI